MNDIVRLQTLYRRHQYYRDNRYRFLKCFVGLAIKRMVKNKNDRSARILDYKVKFLNIVPLCQMFDEIFISGVYHCPINKKKPFIIDCGSNIGISILFFKHLYPEAEMLGFEADKDTYKVLLENVTQNNLKNVTVHNLAVSDREGILKFNSDSSEAGSLMMSICSERETGKVVEVAATPLSKYVTKEVDILKMDIEGAEASVFEELFATGKIHLIKNMVIEYHHHLPSGRDNMARFLRILEESGFGYQISTNYRPPHSEGIFQDILVYAFKK